MGEGLQHIKFSRHFRDNAASHSSHPVAGVKMRLTGLKGQMVPRF